MMHSLRDESGVRRSAIAAVWLAVLAAIPLARSAPAQPVLRRDPPAVVISHVDFGWDNTMIPERFSPVIVWLTSTDGPVAGELSIEYKQDATQSARYSIPFATTPGRLVPFEIAACLPKDCDEIGIVADDGYRKVVQWHSQFGAPGSAAFKDMPIIEASVSRVLLIGDLSARSAFVSSTIDLAPVSDASQSPEGADDPGEQTPPPPKPPPPAYGSGLPEQIPLWKRAKATRLSPENLPRIWASYQSLDAAVVSTDDVFKIDPRALEALLTWVDSGGRLIVLANTPGPEWRRFLTPGRRGDCLSMGDSERTSLDGEIQTDIRTLQGASDVQPYTIPVRPVSLTDQGRREGWQTLWELEPRAGGPNALATPTPRAAAAFGPRGFGMVAILGADPRNMPPVLSAVVERGLWRQVIERMLPTHVRNKSADPYAWSGPYSDYEANTAHNAALDLVTTAEPIGAGVFVIIAGAMAGLVALVGPFDGLITRRRRFGAFSWLPAVLWVALATAAAYVAPTLARSGQTLLSRLTIVETLCGEDGEPVHTVSIGLTGVFGGKPAQPALSGAAPGGWWRGVSAVYYGNGSGRTFSPLEAPIRTAAIEGDTRSAVPTRVAQGQWTFRTLMDLAPAATDSSQVGARIVRVGDAWELTLLNIPEAARISRAELLVGGDLYTVSQEDAQADGRRVLRAERAVPDAERRWISAAPYVGWQQQKPGSEHPLRFHTQAANMHHVLPPCRDRIDAAEARTFLGQYATLSMEVAGVACDLSFANLQNVKATQTRMVRLTMPVPPADAEHIRRPTPAQIAESHRTPSIPTDTVQVIPPIPPPPPPPPASGPAQDSP